MKKSVLLGFLVLFITLVCPLVAGNSQDTYQGDPLVTTDWLVVIPREGDYDTGGLPKKIAFSSGGYDLWNFTDNGELTRSSKNIIYWAEATFGFEVTAHTFVGPWDAYPELDFDKQEKYKFFKVGHNFWYQYINNSYYVYWNYLDLGETEIRFEYDNPLRIAVGIKDFRHLMENITIGDEVFPGPTIEADISAVVVSNFTSGPIGNYTSSFSNVGGVEKGEAELIAFHDFDSVYQKIIDYYNDAGIGWEAGLIEKGPSLSQSKAGGDQPGTWWSNPSPARDELYEFDLDMVLAPAINQYVQNLTITEAFIEYYDWNPPWAWEKPWIKPMRGPDTIIERRLLGIQTINYALHWDFEVKVFFYATLPLSAKLEETLLWNPAISMGDIIWNGGLSGHERGRDPLPDDPNNLLDGILNFLKGFLIAICIGSLALAGLVVVVLFYIKKQGGGGGGGVVIHNYPYPPFGTVAKANNENEENEKNKNNFLH